MHSSLEEFIHLWGQKIYISGIPPGSMLAVFSACFIKIYFRKFNIVDIPSMIRYFIMV